MEVVKAFNGELSALYESKPPISKAKMTSITKSAIRGIKFYKHIVQSVEKFIQKCRPEYKVPGLYVIDSIVRQSRHQFGHDKDVFAPRFAKNLTVTFQNLFKCPSEEKGKIIRVLNLWLKNSVFPRDALQPLVAMSERPVPVFERSSENTFLQEWASKKEENWQTEQEIEDSCSQTWSNSVTGKTVGEGNAADTSLLIRLQSIATQLIKNKEDKVEEPDVKFNKKLLDFDYSDEEEEEDAKLQDDNASEPTALALSMAQNLLNNPELLKQLQLMQQTLQQHETVKQPEENFPHNSNGQTDLVEVSKDDHQKEHLSTDDVASSQEYEPDQPPHGCASEEFEKPSQMYNHPLQDYAQQLQECSHPSQEYSQSSVSLASQNYLPHFQEFPQNVSIPLPSSDYILQPQGISDSSSFPSVPGYPAHNLSTEDSEFNPVFSKEATPFMNMSLEDGDERFVPLAAQDLDIRMKDMDDRMLVEPVLMAQTDLDERENESRREGSNSRSRSQRRRSHSPRRSPSISRSRYRHERDRSRERTKEREQERELERQRRHRGFPSKKRNRVTVCSCTLWLGHVPKLVSQEEISSTFVQFGEIVSIDLIPPRGCAYVCMKHRQDAMKAVQKLRNLKLHGCNIKMAWAPGKGVKGKEYKSYWHVDLGASYIPYEKLPQESNLSELEEGGIIDEDTLPEALREKRTLQTREADDLNPSDTVQQPCNVTNKIDQVVTKASATLTAQIPLPSSSGLPPCPVPMVPPPPMLRPQFGLPGLLPAQPLVMPPLPLGMSNPMLMVPPPRPRPLPQVLSIPPPLGMHPNMQTPRMNIVVPGMQAPFSHIPPHLVQPVATSSVASVSGLSTLSSSNDKSSSLTTVEATALNSDGSSTKEDFLSNKASKNKQASEMDTETLTEGFPQGISLVTEMKSDFHQSDDKLSEGKHSTNENQNNTFTLPPGFVIPPFHNSVGSPAGEMALKPPQMNFHCPPPQFHPFQGASRECSPEFKMEPHNRPLLQTPVDYVGHSQCYDEFSERGSNRTGLCTSQRGGGNRNQMLDGPPDFDGRWFPMEKSPGNNYDRSRDWQGRGFYRERGARWSRGRRGGFRENRRNNFRDRSEEDTWQRNEKRVRKDERKSRWQDRSPLQEEREIAANNVQDSSEDKVADGKLKEKCVDTFNANKESKNFVEAEKTAVEEG